MSNALFLGNYDPNACIILLDDQEVYGFTEGDMVVVERSEDFSTEKVGTKGEVSRAINRNATGTITIRLQHNSPFVRVIEEWANADYPPVVNFTVKDPASSAQFGSSLCWLKTDATHNFGDEVGDREYVFFTSQIRRGSPNLNLFSSLAYAAFQGLS
jgi:hypothetical protein